MRKHLQDEMERIKVQIGALATAVEENVAKGIQAVLDGSVSATEQVIETDRAIDAHEVVIEEECMKVIALHQPVADDLRHLVSASKVDHELERIGDLGVAIAKLASSEDADSEILKGDIARLSQKVRTAVSLSIDSFMRGDAHLAGEVWLGDDEIDDLADAFEGALVSEFDAKTEKAETLLRRFAVCQHLERMGDHAANIAKDVIYLVTGEIARHRASEFRAARKKDGGAESATP